MPIRNLPTHVVCGPLIWLPISEARLVRVVPPGQSAVVEGGVRLRTENVSADSQLPSSQRAVRASDTSE